MFFLVTDSDPDSRRIQEAYVIAVEQQTKDNIRELASRNNVPTTDLTNLPPLEKHHHPDNSLLNGYREFSDDDDLTIVNNNNNKQNASYANTDGVVTIQNSIHNPGLVNGTVVHEPSVRAVHLPRQKRVKLDGWLSNSEGGSVDSRDFDFSVDAATSSNNSRTVTASVEIPPHGLLEEGGFDNRGFVEEPWFESSQVKLREAPPDLDELERRLASGDNLGLNNNAPLLGHEASYDMPREVPAYDMPREVPVDVPASFMVQQQHTPPHQNGGTPRNREVAVDCPPSFVAASGMKNPPQQYHNNHKNGKVKANGGPRNGGPSNGLSMSNGPVNGTVNGTSNGPVLVNGSTDHGMIINSSPHHNNKNGAVVVGMATAENNRTRNNKNLQNENNTRQKVPNDRRAVSPSMAATLPSSAKVAMPPSPPTEQVSIGLQFIWQCPQITTIRSKYRTRQLSR